MKTVNNDLVQLFLKNLENTNLPKYFENTLKDRMMNENIILTNTLKDLINISIIFNWVSIDGRLILSFSGKKISRFNKNINAKAVTTLKSKNR